MSEIPDDFGEQISRLHPHIMMVVPSDLLQSWFPPSTPSRAMDEKSKADAQIYAAKFGCVFHYSLIAGDCEQGEGVFRKA